jgi:hypothetical protein
MAGTFRRRSERNAPRALIPSLAIVGVGAAVAFAAAVPGAAVASAPHHAMSTHHASSPHASAKHRDRRLVIKGLIAGHRGRTVTVFARTAKVGVKTRHNERLRVTFARTAHARSKLRVGDHISIAATGTVSGHHVTIRHDRDEMVTPAPATLLVGTVDAVNANVLTVSENDRDNGDHHDGDDNDNDGGRGGDNDGISPADHSPGGPGDGGNGGGQGHQVMIDDTNATITVNGASGTIAVGDTVVVLGEATDNTFVASTVWDFTTAPAFMRGEVKAVSGDDVTIRDDGNTSTVSLTGVPLALNGDVGATPSQLVEGDKLLVIGPFDATTGQVTPELAFAFNDNDNNPCGDNDGQDHDGGHGGDGGSDG